MELICFLSTPHPPPPFLFFTFLHWSLIWLEMVLTCLQSGMCGASACDIFAKPRHFFLKCDHQQMRWLVLLKGLVVSPSLSPGQQSVARTSDTS